MYPGGVLGSVGAPFVLRTFPPLTGETLPSPLWMPAYAGMTWFLQNRFKRRYELRVLVCVLWC